MHSVEDLFAVLDVPFDERVLAVHRMRILRRFGRALEQLEVEGLGLSEQEYRSRCAAELSLIHQQCARGMREAEPVFRGISQQLVQLRRGPTITVDE